MRHRCECKKSVLCTDCIEQSIDPLQKKPKKTEEQESEEKIYPFKENITKISNNNQEENE